MKKSFIIAAIALLVGCLSLPAKAAEDVLIVNLQYVVSQSKSGLSLRKQSEALNKEVVDLRDSISKDLQAKGKKLEDDKTLLAPEVFQERLLALQTEAESKQSELQSKVQKIQEAIQRASASIDSVMSPILTELVNLSVSHIFAVSNPISAADKLLLLLVSPPGIEPSTSFSA